ncbi:hypothetical protein LL912_12450 [Niabella sp. CC-SYL272]|nr:hypothetical protein [Niabella agricola]MCF3109583.1 hypothetical protein [Niabella agricola]
MSLTIEHIGEAKLDPYRLAVLYSFCHYRLQEGDLVQCPEMCFAVIDDRRDKKDYSSAIIVPYMYRLADMGIDEMSIRQEGDRFVSWNVSLQREHTEFANDWLENIRQQGFLAQLARGNTDAPHDDDKEDD